MSKAEPPGEKDVEVRNVGNSREYIQFTALIPPKMDTRQEGRSVLPKG